MYNAWASSFPEILALFIELKNPFSPADHALDIIWAKDNIGPFNIADIPQSIILAGKLSGIKHE